MIDIGRWTKQFNGHFNVHLIFQDFTDLMQKDIPSYTHNLKKKKKKKKVPCMFEFK